jgi:RNA polymerase sigma-70 factor, ECF subfamily
MEVTLLLQRLRAGDQEALNAVIPLVYGELKKLARAHLRREANLGALQTTALVHEAFLRLAGSQHPSYENRAHFYGIASRVMRQILVSMARRRRAQKRSAVVVAALSDTPSIGRPPDASLLVMDEVLRKLEQQHPLKAQLIEMRFFGGMTAEESATALTLPVHIIRRELRVALAWLQKEMAT